MSDLGTLPAPPLARVEFSFEYSFAEFKEGLGPTDRASATTRMWLRIIRMGFWVLLVAALLFLLFLFRITIIPASLAQVPDLWLALIPSALAAGAVIIFVVTTQSTKWVLTKLKIREKWPAIAVPIIVYYASYQAARYIFGWLASPSHQPWPGSLTEATIIAFLPWAAMFFIMQIRVAIFRRRLIRKQWTLSPGFHRRRNVLIDREGLTVDDGIMRHLYRWPGFKSARETDRLLILIDEQTRRHILPKRAFPTEVDLQVARYLVATSIGDTKLSFGQQGFPVAAIPVLPLSAAASA